MKSIVAFGLGLVVVLAGTVCLAGDPGDAVLGDPEDGLDIWTGVQMAIQENPTDGNVTALGSDISVYVGQGCTIIGGYSTLDSQDTGHCASALVVWIEVQARIDLKID